jgi:hypothetical protein
MLPRIELRGQVFHLDIVIQRLKTVRIACRDVKPAPVFGRELEALPASVGRRTFSQIDDDIVNHATNAADNFYLGPRARTGNACCGSFPASRIRGCAARRWFRGHAQRTRACRRYARKTRDDRSRARARLAGLRRVLLCQKRMDFLETHTMQLLMIARLSGAAFDAVQFKTPNRLAEGVVGLPRTVECSL